VCLAPRIDFHPLLTAIEQGLILLEHFRFTC
jgi:hypothetical protein